MRKPTKNKKLKLLLLIKGGIPCGARDGIILFVLLSLPNLLHSQCAMCRAALESSGDNGLAEGINNGIVFLMAIPYMLVGIIGYIIYRMIKKTKNKTA